MWLHVPSTALPSAPAQPDLNSVCTLPWATSTELSVTSSGKHSLRPLSWRGWRTRPWIRLLSGTTSPPSTVARGAAEWISSLPAFPVPRSVRPANGVAPMMSVTSGRTSGEPSATWDPASSTWRTLQGSLLTPTGYDEWQENWPRTGSTRSGCLWPRRRLVAPRNASGSSCWPTATSADSRSSGGNPNTTGTHGTTLTDRAVRMWPSPTVPSGGQAAIKDATWRGASMYGPDGTKRSLHLSAAVQLWATPQARDVKGAFTGHRQGGKDLPGQAQDFRSSHRCRTTSQHGEGSCTEPRALNPRFVEWLMGWPIGWTDCTAPATESWRSWRRMHSSALRDALACGQAAGAVA